MARHRSEVAAGDQIGPVTVPVSRETLRAYANASGDLNPIHTDEQTARSVGLPDVIAHGMWTMAAAIGVVADWAGDAGRLESVRTRFTSMVVVPVEGAQVEVSATVASLDSDGRAGVDITATAQGTRVLGRCSAVVRLD